MKQHSASVAQMVAAMSPALQQFVREHAARFPLACDAQTYQALIAQQGRYADLLRAGIIVWDARAGLVLTAFGRQIVTALA